MPFGIDRCPTLEQLSTMKVKVPRTSGKVAYLEFVGSRAFTLGFIMCAVSLYAVTGFLNKQATITHQIEF